MKFYLIVNFIFLNFLHVFAQQDTSRLNFNDSLSISNPSIIDSPRTKKTYDVDTTIYAQSSDSLIFYVNEKKMNIFGEGELQYKQTDLKSANIFVDFNTNNIQAEGAPSDSIPNEKVGTPVLTEAGEVYKGKSMTYNFKTGGGFISSAGTESEGAIYTGAKIKKVSKDDYFIEDGIYTTCDAVPPHYYFYASKMKVIQKREIAAKWIWLFFGDVPFPVPLPFAVFPIESGRRSGIIPPAFSQSGDLGFYFAHFGYFWAISDYMDLNLTSDYYTRGSWGLNGRFRYAKRYNFSGNLEGGYRFLKSGEASDLNREINKEWRIYWRHNQTLSPTLRFDANLEFVSGKNYTQNSVFDINQALRNTITSNATIFKSWDESGNRLSLSYTRNQDLETGNISEILPNLTFSTSQNYPFKTGTSGSAQHWYEQFSYNYSGQFQNNRNKTAGNFSVRGGIRHNLRASMPAKIGYVNFSPTFSYEERWYNKKIEKDFAGLRANGSDSIITNDVKEINFVRTFSAGVSATTKIYGMFQPQILGIAALRHTLIPTVSYNYSPDFSKKQWGYFDSYTDSEGNIVRYNKFEREIFGGPSSGEQQNISFSLSNIFEMKTQVDPTDTTSKEKKIQLLNLNASMNYNFAADSLKFSDLNLGYRTQVGDWFNFSGSSSFTMYETSSSGQRINKFLINEGKGLFRLTNFNFSVSTNLSGEKLKSSEDEEKPDTFEEDEYQIAQSDNKIYTGIYDDPEEPDFSIPWNLSLSYNYNLDKQVPGESIIRSNLTAGVDFNLTPNWKLTFNGSYDFDRNELAAPQIRISRDLHEWVMNFTWNPIGTFRGYYFEIKIKAPQLQDFKVTKRDQFYSGF